MPDLYKNSHVHGETLHSHKKDFNATCSSIREPNQDSFLRKVAPPLGWVPWTFSTLPRGGGRVFGAGRHQGSGDPKRHPFPAPGDFGGKLVGSTGTGPPPQGMHLIWWAHHSRQALQRHPTSQGTAPPPPPGLDNKKPEPNQEGGHRAIPSNANTFHNWAGCPMAEHAGLPRLAQPPLMCLWHTALPMPQVCFAIFGPSASALRIHSRSNAHH